MTQAQINRNDMFEAVITFLERNKDRWSSTPKAGVYLAKLKELFKEIEGHIKAQHASKVFVHKNKSAQKLHVAEKADILNDMLAAYAADKEDPGLESKVNKSQYKLYELRNEDFKTVITETIKLLDKHLAELDDYGVTEPQITYLKESFDHFLVLNGQIRQYRIGSVVATKSLKELFTLTHELFKTRLDRVMKGYKEKDPEFYKGYLAARVVVNK